MKVTDELENYIVGEFSGLGWINCDRFYDTNETITMKFSIDGGDSETPYSMYLIFKDINSVLPIYTYLYLFIIICCDRGSKAEVDNAIPMYRCTYA